MNDQNQDPKSDPPKEQTKQAQKEDPQPNPENSTQDNTQSPASDDSNQDLAKIQQELENTKQKLEEMTGISQRALADLQNYKRRVEEEKAGFINFANATVFMQLLPSIENIHRTLEHENKDEEWSKGAEQTMKQILQICETAGLKTQEVKTGDAFDPNIHEALMTAPGEKDKILEVLENGYLLGERVLKPARVKVGNGEKA